MQAVLDLLLIRKKNNEATIIIMDEFDLFATLPKKQTFLYTILDLLQNKLFLLCIIGISTRLDTIELLEKRVKSRISQSHLLVTPYLSTSFTAVDHLNQIKKSILNTILTVNNNNNISVINWNKNVEELLVMDEFWETIEKVTDLNQDIRYFYLFVKYILYKVVEDNDVNNEEDNDVDEKGQMTMYRIKEGVDEYLNGDNKIKMMLEIPLYEIGLLIAIQMLIMKEYKEFNFEQVYKEYTTFVSKHYTTHIISKSLSWKSFEHLIEIELIKPVNSRNSKGSKLLLNYISCVSRQQLINTVNNHTECPTVLQQWLIRWLE